MFFSEKEDLYRPALVDASQAQVQVQFSIYLMNLCFSRLVWFSALLQGRLQWWWSSAASRPGPPLRGFTSKHPFFNRRRCHRAQIIGVKMMWEDFLTRWEAESPQANSTTWHVVPICNLPLHMAATFTHAIKTRQVSSVYCRPYTAEAPPIGKLYQFSKIAVTFEPAMRFRIL